MSAGDVIVLGSADFRETPESGRARYRYGYGWEVQRVYRGPRDDAKIQAQCDLIMLAGGQDIDIGRGHPTIITASFPDQSAMSSWQEATQAEADAEWELMPYTYARELSAHPAFHTNCQSATALAAIKTDLKKGYDPSLTDWEAQYPDGGKYNTYAKLRTMGQTTYDAYTWMLRKTRITSRVGSLKAEYVNVNKVMAFNEIGVPSRVKFDRPPKIRDYVQSGGYSVVPLAWGDLDVLYWLRRPPTVYFSGKKYRIVDEWLGSAYGFTEILYEGGTFKVA